MTARTPRLHVIIDATLCRDLCDSLARALPLLGHEAVLMATLASSKCIAEMEGKILGSPANITAATASEMIPVYAKPSASKIRKRPGAIAGHPGALRAASAERIHKQYPVNSERERATRRPS